MLLDVLTHLPLTLSSIWLTLTNRRFEQQLGGDYVYETVCLEQPETQAFGSLGLPLHTLISLFQTVAMFNMSSHNWKSTHMIKSKRKAL